MRLIEQKSFLTAGWVNASWDILKMLILRKKHAHPYYENYEEAWECYVLEIISVLVVFRGIYQRFRILLLSK